MICVCVYCGGVSIGERVLRTFTFLTFTNFSYWFYCIWKHYYFNLIFFAYKYDRHCIWYAHSTRALNTRDNWTPRLIIYIYCTMHSRSMLSTTSATTNGECPIDTLPMSQLFRLFTQYTHTRTHMHTYIHLIQTRTALRWYDIYDDCTPTCIYSGNIKFNSKRYIHLTRGDGTWKPFPKTDSRLKCCTSWAGRDQLPDMLILHIY